jgi:peptide deformylase
MTAQIILKMGNPVLRQVASNFKTEEILSEDTKILLENMWETLEIAGGIGLAAPQIGVSKQLAIIKLSSESERYPEAEASEPFVIFNPEISILDNDLQGFWEGCLSVPGLRGYVERPKKIRIDYLNEFAEQQSIVLEEFLATVFQHELDHLIGMLYVDRMEDVGTLMFEDEMDLLNEIGEDEILD